MPCFMGQKKRPVTGAGGANQVLKTLHLQYQVDRLRFVRHKSTAKHAVLSTHKNQPLEHCQVLPSKANPKTGSTLYHMTDNRQKRLATPLYAVVTVWRLGLATSVRHFHAITTFPTNGMARKVPQTQYTPLKPRVSTLLVQVFLHSARA